MKWISVKERLPDDDDHVIIWLIDEGWWVGYYIDNNWHIDEHGTADDGEITHWMEPPKPPTT